MSKESELATTRFLNNLCAAEERFRRGVDNRSLLYMFQLSCELEVKWKADGRDWKVFHSERPTELINPETVKTLRDITSAALVDAGYDVDQGMPAPVIVIKVGPKSGNAPSEEDHGLKLHCISDGVRGFNTSPHNEQQDHSMRWVVYKDRGTSFGAAFDNRGAVYDYGGFHDAHVRTVVDKIGAVECLVAEFADHYRGNTTLELYYPTWVQPASDVA